MMQEILDAIVKFETIIIHRHVRPDPDAYGSQGGLAELIKESFPGKNVFVVGEEEESLHFLNRMETVPEDTYQNALVIVCDTANQERISDQRYKNGKYLIKIDHHPNHDAYGDITWVDTSASSVSEMIYSFYSFGQEQGLVMNKKAATLIYAGIVGDTGRFQYSNTTEKTMKIASELIGMGIDTQPLYNQLYALKANLAKLKGYVLQQFNLSENGVAYLKLTKELLNEFGVTPNETSQFVGVLGDIEGVKVWVFFVEEEEQIRVRMRSKQLTINKIAEKYNGGGHPLASGATIYKWEEASLVLGELEKLCKE